MTELKLLLHRRQPYLQEAWIVSYLEIEPVVQTRLHLVCKELLQTLGQSHNQNTWFAMLLWPFYLVKLLLLLHHQEMMNHHHLLLHQLHVSGPHLDLLCIRGI